MTEDGMTIINAMLAVAARHIHHSGGAMLPWETPVGLSEARRRFDEDEDEEFEDYDFDEDEEGDDESDEDDDEDVEDLDEDDEDYEELEQDFDDDEGGPRPPRRKKDWE